MGQRRARGGKPASKKQSAWQYCRWRPKVYLPVSCHKTNPRPPPPTSGGPRGRKSSIRRPGCAATRGPQGHMNNGQSKQPGGQRNKPENMPRRQRGRVQSKPSERQNCPERCRLNSSNSSRPWQRRTQRQLKHSREKEDPSQEKAKRSRRNCSSYSRHD